MKFKLLTFAIVVFFISCSNDEKTTEITKHVSTLKSDILLQSVVNKPFSRPDSNELVSLTLSGTTILEATATFKVVNMNGEEVHCETFPAKDLIQPDYKTANSVLKEAHLRDVVKGYFVDDQILRIAQETGIKLVATNDTHYLNQKDADVAHKQLMDQLQKARTAMIKDNAALEVLDQELQEHAKARSVCEQKPEFDAQFAQEKRDYLDESCSGELDRIIFEAAKKAQSELQLHEKKKYSVRDAVAEYKAKYHGGGLSHQGLDQISPDSSHEELESYVSETLQSLVETELAQYREKAESARKEAESAFRSDFVAHLNDQINQIKV